MFIFYLAAVGTPTSHGCRHLD